MATAQVNRARMQFLTWVRNNFPDLYNVAIETANVSERAQMLEGFGARQVYFQRFALRP